MMKKKVLIFGAGAVGGYVGGQLAEAGEDVLLVDPWPEHVECIKREGLHLHTPEKEITVQVPCMHLHEVQRLHTDPVDIAFISTKSYDTEWAAAMIKQYLAPAGFIVSLQNSINEERIAGIVGWGKTVGCVVSLISVELFKAGHIIRTVKPGTGKKLVFHVGEVHGRITPRAEEIAALLRVVDGAAVTTNLWGKRWTKLVVNAMNNAVSAVTGLNSRMIVEQEAPRHLSIKIGCEAIQVGRAMGYDFDIIRGMKAATLLAAGRGEPGAENEIYNTMCESVKHKTDAGRPSTAQDFAKGRRSEIDFINGLVVQKGKEVGVPTPLNEAITILVKRIERGELNQDPANVQEILI